MGLVPVTTYTPPFITDMLSRLFIMSKNHICTNFVFLESVALSLLCLPHTHCHQVCNLEMCVFRCSEYLVLFMHHLQPYHTSVALQLSIHSPVGSPGLILFLYPCFPSLKFLLFLFYVNISFVETFRCLPFPTPLPTSTQPLSHFGLLHTIVCVQGLCKKYY